MLVYSFGFLPAVLVSLAGDTVPRLPGKRLQTASNGSDSL